SGSGLGCEAEDDIDPRGQLANPRARDWHEVRRDRLARLRVSNPAIDAVPIVARETFDVELGRQQLLAVLAELDMDVGCPPGIGDGLDRPEIILAGRAGEE